MLAYSEKLLHNFSVNIEDASSNVQMELAELQCNSDLKDEFNNVELLEF